MTASLFLSAEWRYIAMLNYEVDPDILRAYVPFGCELDSFEGRTLASLVGFRFLRTRILGVFVPFHRDFDEVNLRFYVRRFHEGKLRRGVVFIREIVPKIAVAQIARIVYGERYMRLPMKHSIQTGNASGIAVEYQWRLHKAWNRLHAEAAGEPFYPAEGGLEQFITEHYWGYASLRDGGALEYKVAHVPWKIWAATSACFEGDAAALYGPQFAPALNGAPHSAFIAEGSSVEVFRGELVVNKAVQ